MKLGLQPIRSFVLKTVATLLVFQVAAAQQPSGDQARKFDEFNSANWENAMAHLDGFALTLNNNPNELGVLIIYGGQNHPRGESKAWSACVKDYLVNRRSINGGRLIMKDGGYRKSLTVELWGIADRKYVPTPSPEISPKHVKFRNGRIRYWRRMCNI
jgi:hypothetical protein